MRKIMNVTLHKFLNNLGCIGLILFKTLVLMCLINWHLIVYFGLPEISYWLMMGVMVVMSLLTKNLHVKSLSDSSDKEESYRIVAISILYLAILGISWLAI